VLLAWQRHAWEDSLYWQAADRKVLLRINELLKDALRHPFEGVGKPEPLKGTLKGYWSRRITQEHRLVYTMIGEGENKMLVVAQCRFHY
jgi:toxin YoeB